MMLSRFLYSYLLSDFFDMSPFRYLPIFNEVACSKVFGIILSENPSSDWYFENIFPSICGLSWDFWFQFGLNF